MAFVAGQPRKLVTEKRVGPPCPSCNRPLPISDVPKSEEAIARLRVRAAKLEAKLAKLQGITVRTMPVKVE